MANARLYVEAPTFTAQSYGLISATATLPGVVRTSSDNHWQLGVTYEELCGSGGTTYDACFAVTGSGLAPAPTPQSKSANGTITRRGSTAFTVYTEVDCSAPGFWDRADDVVSRMLTESEQWQVEQAFWTGNANGQPVVYPHLAAEAEVVDEMQITLQTAATVISGSAALDPVEGLGVLEAALADCYDGVGFIHIPRNLAPAFSYYNLLIPDGTTRYRTPNGHIVILGSGYRGTGPDGTSTFGSTWIYATGALFIYRGSARVMPRNSSLDKAENTVRAIAERTYVLGWECCHLAVRIANGGVGVGAAAGSGL